MNKIDYHLLVCASFRVQGEPKGVCHKKGSVSLLQYLETEINDRGIPGVAVSSTGCLKYCDKGPVMVVYPQGVWYQEVNESLIDTVLDGMENGKLPESGRMN
jgi:(2Fe-2S) ferredoxin